MVYLAIDQCVIIAFDVVITLTQIIPLRHVMPSITHKCGINEKFTRKSSGTEYVKMIIKLYICNRLLVLSI